MSDEIDFLLRVCGPKIDCEDKVRGIDITVRKRKFSPVLR